MVYHPSSARFHEIRQELGELHDRKQQDYGTDTDPFANVRQSAKDWGLPPWQAAMLRLTDKVRRLQSYAHRGSLANEGVSDSFDDIAVYAVIARVLWEEEGEGQMSGPFEQEPTEAAGWIDPSIPEGLQCPIPGCKKGFSSHAHYGVKI